MTTTHPVSVGCRLMRGRTFPDDHNTPCLCPQSWTRQVVLPFHYSFISHLGYRGVVARGGRAVGCGGLGGVVGVMIWAERWRLRKRERIHVLCRISTTPAYHILFFHLLHDVVDTCPAPYFFAGDPLFPSYSEDSSETSALESSDSARYFHVQGSPNS